MALYTVLRGTRIDTIHVYKCTGDPEVPGNWSVQDTYVLDSVITTIWGYVQGDDIHIAVTCFGSYGQHPRDASYVKYLRFDPGTDLFIQTDAGNNYYDDTVDDSDGNLSTWWGAVAASVGATIAVRSDGDVVIGYANVNEKLAYSVKEGGSWTRGTEVASLAQSYHAVAVMGDSDRVHFFYHDSANTFDLFHRSLSSANALGNESVVDSGMGLESGNQIAGAVAFDDGTKRIRVAYSDQPSIPDGIATAYGPDQENPGWTIEINASDDDPDGVGENITADLVVDGDDSWLVYSAGTDRDIWVDVNDGIGGWGVDTEEVPNVTCQGLSAGVYTRSGQQLGILWYDGDIKFTEKALAAGPVQKNVADVGGGVEALAELVSLSVPDVGGGADVPAELVSLSIPDVGGGVDATPSESVSLSVPETGGGTEALAGTITLTVTETGGGTETTSESITLAVPDVGGGLDAISAMLLFAVSDVGGGVDAIASLLASLSIPDVGGGVDVPSESIAPITVPETGGGADVPTEAVSLSVPDVGGGAGAPAIAGSIPVGDVGGGTEVPTETVSLPVTDAGSGADVPAITVLLAVSEIGGGTDAPAITVTLTIADVGGGAGAINVDTGAAGLFKQVLEAASGLDSISSIAASIPVADAGGGVDNLPSITVTFTVSDAGTGTDVFSFINAFIEELGHGSDRVKIIVARGIGHRAKKFSPGEKRYTILNWSKDE